MNRSCKIVGAALAAALFAAPMAVCAQVSLDVTVAPPAPRYEAVPPPRPGFVWAPGYWGWHGGRWAWGSGRWIAARPGYRWAPDVWVRRGAGWHHVPGHWVG
jgi:hypothetical protein